MECGLCAGNDDEDETDSERAMSRVSVYVYGCLTQTGRGRRRGGYIRIL